MTPEHVLVNTSATITMTFSTAADGAVTVNIVDANGTSIVSGGSTSASGATYTYQLAPRSELAELTVTWSGTWGAVAQSLTSHVKIVGGDLFSIAEARAFDDQLLSSTSYSDALLREVRAGIAEFFLQETNVSFVPMYARDVLDGPRCSADLWVNYSHPNRVIALTQDSSVFTAAQIADVAVYPTGKLRRGSSLWNYGHRNITVEYEHGYQQVPWEIKRAALVLARYTLVETNISDRTISYSNELGTFRQSLPGRQYPTGIPVVDAALDRYSQSELIA